MTIHYVLQRNKLIPDPEIYAAQVSITDSMDLEAIAQRMLDQGSSVTKPDILMVLESAIQAVESLLLEGSRVNLGGLCDLYPKISGKFNGMTDTYDPTRHQVDVGATPGKRVRKTVRDFATVEKDETVPRMPSILEFVDSSRTAAGVNENPTIKSWTIGTLNGHRLKFNEAAADEGIYLIGTSTTTKLTTVQRNMPSQLVFQIGELPTSTVFYLEVRTRFAPEGDLKITRFPQALSPSTLTKNGKNGKKAAKEELIKA